MSHANRREQKKLRRLKDALRVTPEASIDLVQWLKDRRHAQTTGEAEALLREGFVGVIDGDKGVEVGRYPVKFDEDDQPTEYEVERLVPASLRPRLLVAWED